MASKADYWFDIADYDFQTAKAMLKTSRYLYVGFMCHQTIEKALKAVIAHKTDEIPPKIHDLSKLAVRANLYYEMSEEQNDFIERLNPLNIEARYPEYKTEIAVGFSKEICDGLIEKTEKLLCWIKERL